MKCDAVKDKNKDILPVSIQEEILYENTHLNKVPKTFEFMVAHFREAFLVLQESNWNYQGQKPPLIMIHSDKDMLQA